MAGWLSSKLKAAEQLLQQIDQQAAVAANKEDKTRDPALELDDAQASEKQSRPFRKDKDAFGGPSTSEQAVPQRGQGRLFDRQLNSSKPGRRKEDAEKREGSTSGRPSRPSSQRKSEKNGREDWSEFLGFSDPTQGVSSSSRSGNSRITDLDTQNGTSSKGSRTRTSASKTPTLFGATTAQPSKILLDADTLPSVSVKAVPQELSPARSSPLADHSDIPLEKVITSRDVEERINGSTVEVAKENLSMASDVPGDVNLAQEVQSGKSGIILETLPVDDGDATGEMQQTKIEPEAVELSLETPPRDSSSESSDVAEDRNLNVILEGRGSAEVGLSEDATRRASDAQEGGDRTESAPSSLVEQPHSVSREEEENFEVGKDEPVSSVNNDNAEPSLLRKLSAGLLEIVEIAPNVGHGSEDDGGSVSGSEVEDSDSGTDRDWDSDSDYEEKRSRRAALRRKLQKRREEEAKAAAEEAAKGAIKERELLLETLKREKETLEALLAEGEEQHVKKAEELRSTMLEVVQLLEQEKQGHNATRRQGLELELTLEAENAALARALATSQWDLEEISSRVSKIRAKVEAKEDECSNLERESAMLRFRLSRQPKSKRTLSDSYEVESVEEEKSRLASKIEQYRMRAEDIEETLKRMMDRHQTPTPIQLELEAQLTQITDSLLLKQAQLEDLSTEKATLVFRVEAASNTLREAKLALMCRSSKRNTKNGSWAVEDWSTYDEDLEYGIGKTYHAKGKNNWDSEEKYDHFREATNGQPFVRLVRQVDGIVMGAALILRRSGMARALAFLYMLLLHWLVLFIIFSHPTTIPESSMNTRNNFVQLPNSVNQNMTSL